MTGASCAFLLTKSSDLPLYYYYFFLHMNSYVVIDSLAKDGYCEASSYVGGFDLGDVRGHIASLNGYSL
jgi:hypothetical protein